MKESSVSPALLWITKVLTVVALPFMAADMLGKTVNLALVFWVVAVLYPVMMLNIAWHEAGHAVTARCLGHPVSRVIIGAGPIVLRPDIGRTGVEIRVWPSGGLTTWDPDEETSLAHRVLVTGAGPAASTLGGLLALVARPHLGGSPPTSPWPGRGSACRRGSET